ncbi:alpha/beta hydrolase-fold protein [Chryseobacterium suipulveris]|uniref:Alpha/beta hydrolase-fold protein n=2 Tax=Chryseobacterium suipulveris TaxID=2929800 RepID=A0ABY4C0Y9_9FLAO|nr:alpha/beta hydrolase-fold protein [Chryseobacterium suipulveris]
MVIGIDNGGTTRINEYTPWNNPQYGGGEGDQYMQFVAETLKPYVDANYRTKPGAEYNALIGSSLGALISNYGGVKYSGTFSKIGSFSPAYWIVANQFNNYILNSTSNLSNMRIYFVAGTNESATMASDIETVKDNLQTKGLTTANTKVKLDSYGQHNENYWKGEFAGAYQWLFQNTNMGTANSAKKNIRLNFEKNRFFVSGLSSASETRIFDLSGKLLEKTEAKNGWNPTTNHLKTGTYVIKIGDYSTKFIIR